MTTPPSRPPAIRDTRPVPAMPASVRLALGMLIVGFIGAAVLVDPASAAPFDALKGRWLALCAVLGYACLQLVPGPRPVWSRPQRQLAGLAAALVLWIGLAAVLAGPVALSTLCRWLPMGLFVLIGAHPRLAAGGARPLFDAVLWAVALDALYSILQWCGWQPLPLAMAQLGGRYPTGALFGNEGVLALACAVLLPWALWRLRGTPAGRGRLLAATLPLLLVAAIVLNRQLTASLAAGAGLLFLWLAAGRFRRWLRPGLLAAGAILVLLMLPPTRSLLLAVPGMPDAGRWQALTTQRLGAWAAAEAMVLAHPGFGVGPGGYALQAQPYRLQAEQAHRMRLPPPVTATGFSQAHNDYLQLAAECGLPALLLALVLLSRLFGAGLDRGEGDEAREDWPLASLAAVAVAAIAWFPLQVPLIAGFALLLVGRIWAGLHAPRETAR